VQTRTRVIQRLRAILLRHGLVEAQRLVQHDRCLDTVVLPPRALASVAALRRVLALVREEARLADEAVRQAASTDPIVRRLQAIPGVGPVLGLMVRAEIGDLSRFPTPGHLASYAGLVPRVDASAGRVHYGRITRRGSPWLRWALVEAALQGPRRSDPVGRWARRMAIRKGAMKARIAVARALCDDVFHHWHTGA